MRLEARAEASRALEIAAPFAAVAFTLVVCSLLVAWAGVRVGGAYLLLLEGAAGSAFAVSRDADARDAADPHRARRRGRLPRAALQHRRRRPALRRRAGRRGRRPMRRCRCRRRLMYPLMMAAAMAAGALLLLGPALAQDAVRRRRGGDDAAAQFHRAAVRVDAARRSDEGSGCAGLAADRWRSPPSSSCRGSRRARACTRGSSSRSCSPALVWAVGRFTAFGFEMRAVGANARAAAFAGMPVRAVVVQDRAAVGRAGRARRMHRGGGARRLRDARHVAGLRLQRHRHRDAGAAAIRSASSRPPSSSRACWSAPTA